MRRVTAIFREEPTLHRRRFFHGKSLHGEHSPEIAWLDPTGKEMSQEAWQQGHVRCLGVHLMGRIMETVTFRRTARGNVCCLVKRLEAREGREAR